MDIPLELFESISQDMLQRTSFGQRYRETNTEIIFETTNLPKAKYPFGRMDLDGFKVDPADILKKRMSTSSNNLERCEVLASTDKPMELKFHKKKEFLESKRHPTALNKAELTLNLFISFIVLNPLSPNINIQILQTCLYMLWFNFTLV